MGQGFLEHISGELAALSAGGLLKREREITSPQAGRIAVRQGSAVREGVLNLCANNYLGLADHPRLIAAAKQALDDHGFGMASVRFICGTQDLHRALERRLAEFLLKDDAILYAACFDANGGLFEPLLDDGDAIVSDTLNHASIIDGIRLSRARRYRYAKSDMGELEDCLKQARAEGARHIMIATDGVFSMDGDFARLPDIASLAKLYDAVVMVDDCHATGFIGPQGRGTHALFGIPDEIDILTGTLGKALGGALGGYVAGPQPVIDLLRQRSRPYLFSNSLPPPVVAAGLAAIDLVEHGDDLRARLFANAQAWRDGLTELGFPLTASIAHPIVPVMLGEAELAQRMAEALFEEGVYATGFFFPVVPEGKARIRTQMTAALSSEDLAFGLDAFAKAGRKVGAIA